MENCNPLTKSFLNDLSYKVVGCAIEVHKALGPGLLESVYQKCMAHELRLAGLNFQSQLFVPVSYKGVELETEYRLDFLVENFLVLELKAQDGILPVHEAQILTYMKLLQIPKGVLINFNSEHIVKHGTKQMVNEIFRGLPD